MPKYACDRCLKKFSQKSYYDKHINKNPPCQNNKGKMEEVVENIIINKLNNKKLISDNSHNFVKDMTHIETMTEQFDYNKMKSPELKEYCKKNNILGFSNKRRSDIIELINNSITNTKIDTNSISNNGKINFKVGTLFTGIGSIEHALHRLNINHEIVFACDICKYVKQSYFANYKINEEKWFDDVKNIDGTNFKDVDMIVGGSPCQSFSFVGKQKGLHDDRGNLIFEFIRVIKETNPKIFIFENVKGLTTHNKGETFKYVLSKFEELNYVIHYDILNGKDYGIPQSRNRLFLIGINKDHNKIKLNIFPPPKIELHLKMKDLLEDNVNIKYYLQEKGTTFVTKESNIKKKYTQVNGEIALCQKKNQQFNWHGDFIKEYREVPSKYYLSDKVKNYVLAGGTKNFKTSNETDLDIARPLLSSMHKMHRAGVDNYITHEEKIRKLTPRECLRLMGFSDDFKIVVSDTRMYQQAGNSIIVNIFMEILKQIDYVTGFQNN
jgi:DNA (cytosine-5)-methyltransferase 1